MSKLSTLAWYFVLLLAGLVLFLYVRELASKL